jgi:hypothetical protein
MGADQDPEEELEDYRGWGKPSRQDDDGHRGRRAAEDDQEEGGRVDVDQGAARSYARRYCPRVETGRISL